MYLYNNFNAALLTTIASHTTVLGSLTNATLVGYGTSIGTLNTFKGSLTNADLTGVIADMNSIETILNVSTKALNFTAATWTIYNP